MTLLKKPVRRVLNSALSASYGADKARRLVVTIIPGNGTKEVPDMIELRPERTRRSETVALIDVYHWIIRSRCNAELMARLREKKKSKEARREREKIARMDRKLSRSNQN